MTIEEMIPVLNSNYFISSNNEDFKNVSKKYGATHKIEPVHGTKVIFKNLSDNQSVCYGDGKTYHFRLTKK